jgi:hypothetical protein
LNELPWTSKFYLGCVSYRIVFKNKYNIIFKDVYTSGRPKMLGNLLQSISIVFTGGKRSRDLPPLGFANDVSFEIRPPVQCVRINRN